VTLNVTGPKERAVNKHWSVGLTLVSLALVAPVPAADAAGGDACGMATAVGPILMACDGDWWPDEPIGLDTASASGHPVPSCFPEGVDNDRWYSWINSTGAPMEFAASTDAAINVPGDSQIAIFGDCTGMMELACNDDGGTFDQFLSVTPPITVAPSAQVFVMFDGYFGDAGATRAQFRCRPPRPPGAGDNCTDAIPLGALAPRLGGPVVDLDNETWPQGASDVNEPDPSSGALLTQAEICYSFSAMEDGWVQLSGTPVHDASRVAWSADGGLNYTVSKQCWSAGGYDSAPQWGSAVTAGADYCFCIDAHDDPSLGGPVVLAGETWNLEVHYWPPTTQTNVDCASSETINFCNTTTVTRMGLSTAGAGTDPGIEPGFGCSATFWDLCSGDGADINYDFTWTQEMVDCGCTGFTVQQEAPFLSDETKVCDAAIQVATGCPPEPSNCVDTRDLLENGLAELSTVAGLGAAQVGTTYHIQLDHYMTSACPSFDATFALTGCSAGCDVCGMCTPTLPAGAVDNVVRAVESDAADVALSWSGATVNPPNHIVLRTDSKAELDETMVGIGDEQFVGVTALEMFIDVGALNPAAPRLFYKVLPADSCDDPVYP